MDAHDSSGSHASRLIGFLTLGSSVFIPTQRSPATVDGRIDARVASAHSDDSSGGHASRLMEFLTLESSMFIPRQRSLATVDGRIDARVASASCLHH